MASRAQAVQQDKKEEEPKRDKYLEASLLPSRMCSIFVLCITCTWQSKERLDSFVQSLNAKTKKLRSLRKELQKKYTHDEDAKAFLGCSDQPLKICRLGPPEERD